MSTGAEAVAAIAAVTGEMTATVDRAYRFLQATKLDLVPVGNTGGGRYAPQVQPHHLANLLIAHVGAHVGAQPIAASAATVDSYRPLRLDHVQTTRTSRSGAVRTLPLEHLQAQGDALQPDEFLQFANVQLAQELGPTIEAAIDRFSKIDHEKLEASGEEFEVELVQYCNASLAWLTFGDGRTIRYRVCYRPMSDRSLTAEDAILHLQQRGAIQYRAIVPIEMFMTLGNLARDSRERIAERLVTPLGAAPEIAALERETAALAWAAASRNKCDLPARQKAVARGRAQLSRRRKRAHSISNSGDGDVGRRRIHTDHPGSHEG